MRFLYFGNGGCGIPEIVLPIPEGVSRRMDKHRFRNIYTIFVFVALASLDNAVIGLFPPLFSSIARDLHIHVSSLGIVSAINILITALSSLVWGYAADRGPRKILIISGTVVWSIAVFMTAYSKSYTQLVIYQVFTGIGLGCISSIGFSVLTDFFPKKRRGMLMSLWGSSQGFGGIAGSVMASVVAPAATWRRPFEIIAVIGFLFIFLYFFIREPMKGAVEPELEKLIAEGYEYNYVIEYDHLLDIITKKSNVWLMLQGFFLNITVGTLIWLPTLYISKIESLGFSSKTALIASGYLYALLQIGGLASIYFGHLGDKLQRHTYSGRIVLSAFAIAITIPLFIMMFSINIRTLTLVDNPNPVVIFTGLLKEFIINPQMLIMFLLALGATAAQSANSPNWLALLTEVNLPEHRATTFSIANLVNGVGRAAGNIFLGAVLKIISVSTHEPQNYIITMIIFQVFYMVSLFCYIILLKHIKGDLCDVKDVLTQRAKKF